MKASFSLLQDWPSLQDFLQSLGLSKAHIKRHTSMNELKRKLYVKQSIELSLNLLNPKFIAPTFHGPEPKIISEDDRFIVIHKPANVHGHALNYLENDNVLSWLRSIGRGDVLQVADHTHERGLLYRLDFATSGVLVYVKDQSTWQNLRDNFQEQAHLKRYLAVVDKTPSQQGELSAWFDLSGKKIKAYERHRAGTIEGSLTLKVLKEDEHGCVLVIDLVHGHRHQIRSHLALLGSPIRGDQLYGGAPDERLYLHAYCYKIFNELEAYDPDLGFGLNFLNLHSHL